MLVITFTTSPIRAEDSPSLLTVSLVVAATVTAEATTCAASFTLRLISRMDAPISSPPAAAVCTLSETSWQAPTTTFAWVEERRAEPARRCAPWVSCCDAEARACALVAIVDSV